MRLIIDTEDKNIIDQLMAFFKTHSTSEDWFDELPDSVKDSVERGLAESERGEGIPHEEAVKRLKKWL